MGIIGEQISMEEQQIAKIIISIICLYGNDGLPLDEVEDEFLEYCGFSIPWKRFGAESLKSWLITLPYIYLVRNHVRKEVLIEYSPKSGHIKELVVKQKRSHHRQNKFDGLKRKSDAMDSYGKCYDHQPPFKMMKRSECETLPNDFFVHTSIKNVSTSDSEKKFEQLESMLPLFYKHQALGDDFFVDIADTKMGYYVPDKGLKKTGLCCVGQTIAGLTEKVRHAEILAPRVVVMIGFQDLLEGKSISAMIMDLRELVKELKKKNIRLTLVTLIPSPKLPNYQCFETRMDIFNRAILDYASDPYLNCNVIDMNTIFLKESEKLKRDFDRFKKVAKSDPYQVFSDYGRKIFLNALKSSLKEQIDYGH
ncbi:uncharacterized protein [Euwallacea similis]|uniref:uncharacterized protein n=1 Tax=Euwallacea similis TaxID=1736056 RepID=UPI00344EDAB1